MAKQRREDERRRDLALAWHVEAFARQKTLPPLMQLLVPAKPQQSPGEMATVLHMLSDQYGIPLRPAQTVAVHA